MADEAIIAVDSSAAESAASDAQYEARNAETAAAAANAAAINQGQLIEAVTAASREDAAREASRAEAAAAESAAAAEVTQLTIESFATEMRSMFEDHERRMAALEDSRSQPVVVDDGGGVSEISPTEVQDEQQDLSEGGEVEQKSSSKSRRHGRKRR